MNHGIIADEIWHYVRPYVPLEHRGYVAMQVLNFIEGEYGSLPYDDAAQLFQDAGLAPEEDE